MELTLIIIILAYAIYIMIKVDKIEKRTISNSEVKELIQMMQRDMGKFNDRLEQLEKEKK